MRILILGGTGMLGHKLAQVLARDFDTIVTSRSSGLPAAVPAGRLVANMDVLDIAAIAEVLDKHHPDAC
jgi:dTDP-4-dehydrorhamnose reductase